MKDFELIDNKDIDDLPTVSGTEVNDDGEQREEKAVHIKVTSERSKKKNKKKKVGYPT